MADGSVFIDTKLDSSGLKNGLQGLSDVVSKSGVAKLGAGLLKGITAVSAGLVTAGKFAVDVGKDFDTSMSQVMATLGLTGDEAEKAYKIMSEAAKEAGETTQFSAKQSADALNYLALAGYDAQKAADVLPSVLDLAAAGAMDLAYASDLATDAMAAIGIEATGENLQHFGDQMARTASRSNTSVAQLGEAILTVGGVATQLAGGTTELNTALGILANRGIKGAEGGTHLRNIILALTAPTDKAAEAMEALGLQVSDAAGNLRPLDDIMADFNKKTKGMSQMAKMDLLNTIFNKTDLAAIQALIAGTGQEWNDLEKEINNCEGAMHEMAETQLDNLEGDITILKSAVEGLGIAAYQGLQKPLRKAVQMGTEMIGQLTTAMKTGGFAGLAGALGDVLSQVITKIAQYLPKVIDMSVQVIQSLVKGVLQNAGTLATAAIQALSSIADGIMQATPDLLEAGGNILLALAQGLMQKIPSLAATLADVASDLAGRVQTFAPRFISAARALITSLSLSIKKYLPTIIKSLTSMVLQGLKAFLAMKTQLLKLGGSIIKAIGQGLIDALPDIIAALPEIIQGIVDFFATKISVIADVGTTLFSALVDNLPQIFSSVWKAIVNIDWINLGKQIVGAILKAFYSIGNSILSIFGTSIKDITGLGWGDIYGAIQTAFNGLGSWFSGLFGTGKELAEGLSWGGIFAKVKEGFAGLGEWFLGLFTGGKSKVETEITWSEVGSSIEKGVQTVLDTGGKFLKGLFTAGKGLVEKIDWNNLGTVIGNGVNGVIDVGGLFLKKCFTAGKYAIETINWKNLGQVIGKGVNGTIDLAGKFLEGCFTAGKTLVEDIKWDNIGKVIATGVNGTVDTTGLFLKKSFTAAKYAIETIKWDNLGKVIGDGVNNTIDTAGLFLSGCFEAGKAAIEAFPWADTGAKVGELAGQLAGLTLDSISGVFTTGSAAINAFPWEETGTNLGTLAGNLLNVPLQHLNKVFSLGKQAMEAFPWEETGKKLGEVAGKFADLSLSALSGVFDAGKAAVESFPWADTGTKIGELAGKFVDLSATAISGLFDTGKAAIEAFPWEDTGAKLGTLAGDIAEIPIETLSGAFSSAQAAIAAFPWEETGRNIGTLAGNLLNIPLLRINGVFSMGKKAIQAFPWEETGEKLGQLAGDVAGISLDALSGVFKMGRSAVNSFPWERVGKNLGTLAGQVVDVHGELLGEMFKTASEVIQGINWAGIGSDIADGLNRAWGIVSGIGDVALGLGESVVGAGQQGVDALKEWIAGWRGTQDVVSEAEQTGIQIVKDVNEGITGEKDNLVKTGEDVAEALLGGIKGKLLTASEDGGTSPAKSLGQSVATGLGDGIKSKTEEVSTEGTTILGEAFKAMEKAIGGMNGTAFNDIGRAISAGIAWGIKGSTSVVTAAAQTAATQAYNAAKRALRINSPSKAFAQLGAFSMLGMARGIDDNAKTVQKSVTRLADSLISPDITARMQSAVSQGTSDLAQGFDAMPGIMHEQTQQQGQQIDYDQLANAIWDNAPDIGLNLDGVQFARLIEPHVSEQQATKTQNKARRG